MPRPIQRVHPTHTEVQQTIAPVETRVADVEAKVPPAGGTAGQALVRDANGAMVWATPAAAGATSLVNGTGEQSVRQALITGGTATVASGGGSTALGNATTASGVVSFAAGNGTTASATGSIAVGGGAKAAGAYSASFGESTLANADRSFSAGLNTAAYGIASVALGRAARTGASGATTGHSAFAAGTGTVATGGTTDADGGATAMGHLTQATGLYGATALGSQTLASGAGSFAVNSSTTASGEASAALGSGTQATTHSSLATGVQSKASLRAQHAQASGMFAAVGDAQTSVLVARASAAAGAAASLSLTGAGTSILTLAGGQVMKVKMEVVGATSVDGDAGSWEWNGLLRYAYGNVGIQGTPTVTYIGSAEWGAGALTVALDGTGVFTATLAAPVSGAARYVARITLVEVVAP